LEQKGKKRGLQKVLLYFSMQWGPKIVLTSTLGRETREIGRRKREKKKVPGDLSISRRPRPKKRAHVYQEVERKRREDAQIH